MPVASAGKRASRPVGPRRENALATARHFPPKRMLDAAPVVQYQGQSRTARWEDRDVARGLFLVAARRGGSAVGRGAPAADRARRRHRACSTTPKGLRVGGGTRGACRHRGAPGRSAGARGPEGLEPPPMPACACLRLPVEPAQPHAACRAPATALPTIPLFGMFVQAQGLRPPRTPLRWCAISS